MRKSLPFCLLFVAAFVSAPPAFAAGGSCGTVSGGWLTQCGSSTGCGQVFTHFFMPNSTSPICIGRVAIDCHERFPDCITVDYVYDYVSVGSCTGGQCNGDEPPPDQFVKRQKGDLDSKRVYVISCGGELVNLGLALDLRSAQAHQSGI